MSARRERILEKLDALDQQIDATERCGGDPAILLGQRAKLVEELMVINQSLNEGKVLKG